MADTAQPTDRLVRWLDELAEDAGRPVVGQTGRSARPRRVRSRRILLGGALAAVAATVVVIVLPGGGHSGGIAQADPIMMLTAASAYAKTLPDVVPRADQFYYVKRDGLESWASVDGTHDGEILPTGAAAMPVPGCRNGVVLIGGNYDGLRPQPCTPDPAFLADAPTTPETMAGYLQAKYGLAGINGIGSGIQGMLSTHFMRPASLAALFQTATHLDGLRVVSEKAFGSNVIGVTWSDPDGMTGGQDAAVLLFDGTTHAYLGFQTTGLKGEKGGGLDGPEQVTVVDKVGERA
ncbi:MAG: hypothetical protein M3Y89_00780 [Actinomycetota bacterium]|nr:hypothetical protein [Actinomycetota bacterium]